MIKATIYMLAIKTNQYTVDRVAFRSAGLSIVSRQESSPSRYSTAVQYNYKYLLNVLELRADQQEKRGYPITTTTYYMYL